jgi:hypothetical protein
MASALLLLDYVGFIVDKFSSDRTVVDRAGQLLANARDVNLPVFHVVPAAMEHDIHPAVLPRAAEPVLTKTTIGAFGTTNLHSRLQADGIEELILAGIATSGTILSTSRWAFDVGYRVTVCTEACDDPDPRVHAALTDEHVFPQSWLGLHRVANVAQMSAIEVLKSAR